MGANSNKLFINQYIRSGLLVTMAMSFYFISSISLTVFNKWMFTDTASHRELDEKALEALANNNKPPLTVSPNSASADEQIVVGTVQTLVPIDGKDKETIPGSSHGIPVKKMWCVENISKKNRNKIEISWFNRIWNPSGWSPPTQVLNEVKLVKGQQCKGRSDVFPSKPDIKDLTPYNITVAMELKAKMLKAIDIKEALVSEKAKEGSGEWMMLGVSPYNFHFPLTVTFIHQFLVWVLVLLFDRIKVFRPYLGEIERSNGAILTLVPIGFLCGIDWGLSNTSIRYVPLSLYEMVKGASPVVVLVLSFMMKLLTPSPLLVVIILFISFGMTLSVTGGNITFFKADKFPLKGLILLLIATLLSGTRIVLAQYALQQGPPHKLIGKFSNFTGFIRSSPTKSTTIPKGKVSPSFGHTTINRNKNNGNVLNSRRTAANTQHGNLYSTPSKTYWPGTDHLETSVNAESFTTSEAAGCSTRELVVGKNDDGSVNVTIVVTDSIEGETSLGLAKCEDCDHQRLPGNDANTSGGVLGSSQRGIVTIMPPPTVPSHNKLPYNTLTAIYYAAPASALALIAPAVFLEGQDIRRQWVMYNFSQKWQLMTCIFSTSVIAFSLSITEFLVTKLTSALTMCVTGIAKQVFIIGIAMLIFGETVGAVNMIGFIMSLVGIGMYNYIKLKQNIIIQNGSVAFSSSPMLTCPKHFKERSDQIV